jgi:predicted porin
MDRFYKYRYHHVNSQQEIDYELANYDFTEIYDPTKNYNYDQYQKTVDNQTRTYFNILLTFDLHNNTLQYVAGELVLSDEELKKMIPYCRCTYHSTSIFNIMRYLTCRCCIGCLEYNPSQQVIRKTKKYIEKYKL